MSFNVNAPEINFTQTLSFGHERASVHETVQVKNLPKNDKFEQNKNLKSDNNASNKQKLSKFALAGASLGALLSVIYFGKKQYPGVKINSLENLWKILMPEYELKELVGVSTAAVGGGLAFSYPFTDEKDKKSLVRESIFQFVNMNLPTSMVALSLLFCDKKIPEKYRIPAKMGMIAGSVFGGVYAAVKFSDFLKRKIFEKDNTSPPRKITIDNFFVHADDLLGIFVLAKVPFVRTLKLDTILPFLYARAGYEVSKFDEEH